MKKTLYIFATLLLAVVSCKKGNGDNGSDINTDGFTTFNVDTEQIDLFEGYSARALWAEGDRIGVFSEVDENIPYVLQRDGIDKSEALFYGPLVLGEEFLAYYPYSASMVIEDGMIPVSLSSVQHFDKEETPSGQFLEYSNDIVAYATSEENTLHFCYPFGIMAVQIQFEETMMVESISLSAATRGIAGRLLVDGDIDVIPSSISGKTISLILDEPVASRDDAGNFTTFYIVLPPAEYPAKELTLTIVTDTETMNVGLKATEVKRVKGINFPVCNVEVKSDDIPGFNPTSGYLE